MNRRGLRVPACRLALCPHGLAALAAAVLLSGCPFLEPGGADSHGSGQPLGDVVESDVGCGAACASVGPMI